MSPSRHVDRSLTHLSTRGWLPDSEYAVLCDGVDDPFIRRKHDVLEGLGQLSRCKQPLARRRVITLRNLVSQHECLAVGREGEDVEQSGSGAARNVPPLLARWQHPTNAWRRRPRWRSMSCRRARMPRRASSLVAHCWSMCE